MGYVVDLDNADMVQHAKDAIVEDIHSADTDSVAPSFDIIKKGDFSEGDIPEFLLERDCDKCGGLKTAGDFKDCSTNICRDCEKEKETS